MIYKKGIDLYKKIYYAVAEDKFLKASAIK